MITNFIQLDFNKENDLKVPSVQYDSGSRFVKIKLQQNKVPFEINGYRVTVVANKVDGTEIMNDCTILDGANGLVEFEITEQFNAVEGVVDCQLKLFKGKTLLTSMPFSINVVKSVSTKEIVSSNELKTLVNALGEVQNIDNRFAQTNAQLSEVANKGTTVEVLERVTKEEVERQIADGTMANLTLSDNSITGDKIKAEAIGNKHMSNELKKILGVEYLYKTFTISDVVYNRQYVTVNNVGGVTSNFNLSTKYDWFYINSDEFDFTFLHDGVDLYLALSGSDEICYAISLQNNHGWVCRFTKDGGKTTLETIPHLNTSAIPQGSYVTVKQLGNYSFEIYINKDTLWGSVNLLKHSVFKADISGITYGLGQLVYSGTAKTQLHSMSEYEKFGNGIKERVNEVELANITNSTEIAKINDFISENILYDGSQTIIMTSENTTSGAYWSQANATYNTTYNFYFASNSLIPVIEGSSLILKNWGEPTLSALAYSAYDNDGLPYNGSNARINFSSGIYDESENTYTFTIPKGCTQIGLSIKYTNLVIGSDNSATIVPPNRYQLGNTLDRIITQMLGNVSDGSGGQSVNDLSSHMYLKGNAEKSFNKKIAIITAGQSNADGRVPINQLPSYIQLPMTNIHYASNYNGKNLKDGLNTSDLSGNKWAFDLVTYHYLTQVANQEIYVMKWTMGGTSIDINGATDYHWTVFYEQLPSISYSLLRSFESLIRSCVKAKGENFDIRAMLWHQGEGDRDVADNYYDNLKYLIAYCRGIVGNKRLPFICGTVPKKSAQYNATIDKAFRRLEEEDPYFFLVDMADGELLDAYHFNADWSEYFGKCVYNKLIDAEVINASKLNIVKPT